MSPEEKKRLLIMGVVGAGTGMLSYMGVKVLAAGGSRRAVEVVKGQDASDLLRGVLK